MVKEVNSICLLLVYWKIAGIPDKTSHFYGSRARYVKAPTYLPSFPYYTKTFQSSKVFWLTPQTTFDELAVRFEILEMRRRSIFFLFLSLSLHGLEPEPLAPRNRIIIRWAVNWSIPWIVSFDWHFTFQNDFYELSNTFPTLYFILVIVLESHFNHIETFWYFRWAMNLSNFFLKRLKHILNAFNWLAFHIQNWLLWEYYYFSPQYIISFLLIILGTYFSHNEIILEIIRKEMKFSFFFTKRENVL